MIFRLLVPAAVVVVLTGCWVFNDNAYPPGPWGSYDIWRCMKDEGATAETIEGRLVGTWELRFRSCDPDMDTIAPTRITFSTDDTVFLVREDGTTLDATYSIRRYDHEDSWSYQLNTIPSDDDINRYIYLCDDQLYFSESLFQRKCEFGYRRG